MNQQSELAIETRGLSKQYGNFTAVNHLDLKVKKGEIYGLLGPNGAGKTTLIKMLCSILHSTRGKARVLGEEIPDESPVRQLVSVRQAGCEL